MEGFTFCGVAADEVPFVVDSWARSFRDSPWAGCLSNEHYQEAQRATINDLLARGVHVCVAIPQQGDRRVCAFVAYEAPDVIHYVYTKQKFRKMGLADALIEFTAIKRGRFTFRTPASEFLLRRGFVWTPIPARVTCWRPPGVPHVDAP